MGLGGSGGKRVKFVEFELVVKWVKDWIKVD